MVLADARLDAGEHEEGCRVTMQALKLGEQLRSARCVEYLREFRAKLPRYDSAAVREFHDQAAGSPLWEQSLRSQWGCQSRRLPPSRSAAIRFATSASTLPPSPVFCPSQVTMMNSRMSLSTG